MPVGKEKSKKISLPEKPLTSLSLIERKYARRAQEINADVQKIEDDQRAGLRTWELKFTI